MFGLRRKDTDGKQVRIEHLGKIHVHRELVALRCENGNATANTSKVIRLSSSVAHGTRVALQRGKFRLIGRWNEGPLNFKLSKTGIPRQAFFLCGALCGAGRQEPYFL